MLLFSTKNIANPAPHLIISSDAPSILKVDITTNEEGIVNMSGKKDSQSTGSLEKDAMKHHVTSIMTATHTLDDVNLAVLKEIQAALDSKLSKTYQSLNAALAMSVTLATIGQQPLVADARLLRRAADSLSSQIKELEAMNRQEKVQKVQEVLKDSGISLKSPGK